MRKEHTAGRLRTMKCSAQRWQSYCRSDWWRLSAPGAFDLIVARKRVPCGSEFVQLIRIDECTLYPY